MLLAAAVIVAAGLAAYFNSFQGVFVLADQQHITENAGIRRLWPIWRAMSSDWSRPVVGLSLALNYAADGYEVWGYHAVNLAIHVAAALALFGVVRRTLLLKRLSDRFSRSATAAALAVAVIWVVHPLTTAAVTYVSRRTESLMGLFYLLTLYCVVRGSASVRRRRWYSLAVASCALGMASNPVMVTAPLVVLLYDRMFLSKSFKETFRTRWGLYVSLAVTWAILVPGAAGALAGAGESAAGATVWQYARTQFVVIAHYLRLSFLPRRLCLNHALPVATTVREILPSALLVAALLAATGIALWRRSAWGFAGAWFFLILAPTSSVIPTADLACEHRMYLPLAGVVAAVVGGGCVLGGRLLSVSISSASVRRRTGVALGICLVAVEAFTLGARTHRRNKDYHSETAIWSDVVDQYPRSVSGRYNLANAMLRRGDWDAAIGHYRRALRLRPGFADAENHLGIALARKGRLVEAISHYARALRIDPTSAAAHLNLAVALEKVEMTARRARRNKPAVLKALKLIEQNLGSTGNLSDLAVRHYRKAIELDAGLAQAHAKLGSAMLRRGQSAEAVRHYRKALRINPRDPVTEMNLGLALLREGNRDAALTHFWRSVSLNPRSPEARNNLGNALLASDKVDEAIGQYTAAIEAKPDFAMPHKNLGIALSRKGLYGQAVKHYREALRITPNDVPLLLRTAGLLIGCPDPKFRNERRAVAFARRAVRLTGAKHPHPMAMLAATYARTGQFAQAVAAQKRAIELAAPAAPAELMEQMRRRLTEYQSGQPFGTADTKPTTASRQE